MNMKDKKYTYQELLEIIAKLRSEEGCAWDREQTHESLKESLLEESYDCLLYTSPSPRDA